MRDFDHTVNRRLPPPDAVERPRAVSCPSCAATNVSTVSKLPDADSYWRCATCGEVWNPARRQGSRGHRLR